jgi:superfamily II DNA or RNA helicase
MQTAQADWIDDTIATTQVEPRPYQRSIVGKAIGLYADAIKSIMVESPTGSGKTVMGHLIARVLQEKYPDLVVGWVAMRRNLLTQAAEENQQLGIGVRNIYYTSMFDKNPVALKQARAEGKPILIVLDESQHDSASSMVDIHNLVRPDFVLGLTATPFRTDNAKLCFDKTITDAGIHKLIGDGYLSSYNHWNIENWTPENVANHYCAEPDKWGKSVVFFNKWEDCARFTDLVRARQDGVMRILRDKRPDLSLGRSLIESVRGDSGFDYRDKLLDDFRTGDVAVLSNCMILTEGFDADDLETAFVRDSVKGPTMQMGGRALRPHPLWRKAGDTRFRYKNIVQSAKTHWPMTRTASPNLSYQWQASSWRSLKSNPHLDSIMMNCCYVMASVETKLPKYLLDRQLKKSQRGRGSE